MLKYLKNKKGLTLIEILISIAVLSIIMIPIYSLFITSAKMNFLSYNKMTATNIAQKYMEMIKSSATLDWIPTQTFSDGEYDIKITVDEQEDYQFEDQIIEESSNLNYDLKITLEKDNKIDIFDNSGFSRPYINEPINEMNVEFKNDQLIIHNIPADSIVNDPEITGNGTEIKIELYGDQDITIYSYNEENSDLIFYIFKHKDSDSNLKIINNGGKVITYRNVFITDEGSRKYIYRLYKIEIEVYKDEQLMEKLVGYKTFIY